MPLKRDYTGRRFGELTVVKEGDKLRLPSGQTNRTWVCRCDCGSTKVVRMVHLTHGRITTCGHVRPRHGETSTPLYNNWRAMKNRCKKTYAEKHLYADKGITVCEEWSSSYAVFAEWARSQNYRPGMVVDRIDGSKGYSPDNCRITTHMINANNRDKTFVVTYKGQDIPIMMLLRMKNKEAHAPAIRSRINRGWDVDTAVDTPIRKGNYATTF